MRADASERALLLRAVESAAQARERLDRHLAQLVVSELSEALRRGRR